MQQQHGKSPRKVDFCIHLALKWGCYPPSWARVKM